MCRALWVQVCFIQPLYCTGGDHHKAQTGGVIWSSLKLSSWDYNVEVGRNLGPLYDGCLWEMDRAQPQWTEPLMLPLLWKWMSGP